MLPLVEPGKLIIRDSFKVPAANRDKRPSGLINLMASAIPGASRSRTSLVPSGVKSLGPKPVPLLSLLAHGNLKLPLLTLLRRSLSHQVSLIVR